MCENEIGFGRSAEQKTTFSVFLPSASPQSPKFRVRLYRVEFLHSQGHLRPIRRGCAISVTPPIASPKADKAPCRRSADFVAKVVVDLGER
jgi:hypothetical protein